MNGHHENQLKNMLLSIKISCQDVWIALLLREAGVNTLRMLVKLKHLGYGIMCGIRGFLYVKGMYYK